MDRMSVRKAQGSFRGLGFLSVYDNPMGRVHLIRYFSDEYDVRSVGQCLTDAYPTILGVLNSKFPRWSNSTVETFWHSCATCYLKASYLHIFYRMYSGP
jgi:hypothetical protein